MQTATIDQAIPQSVERRSINLTPVSVAIAAIILGTLYLAGAYDWRQGALFLVGCAAGLVLYHSAFGFTSAWRALIAARRGEALRAQMLMLAVTCLVFLPVLANGQIFGRLVRGSVSPVGLSVVIGAFLFGVGMQLGGGCASGTLYTAGGGSVRMVVTLAAFIAGSVAGVVQMPFWDRVPAFAPISLVARFGLAPALGGSLLLFGAVAIASRVVEWRSESLRPLQPLRPRSVPELRPRSILRGPFPLMAGAFGLAAVNIATLVLAGRPWGVTSAFALWGSKLLAATGVDVASWPYWQSPARATELQASVFSDVTSIMDFGIILGALTAAGLAGRFAPAWRVPLKSLVAAVVGGLLLGYGARIAYGCNIGAYFSGIASSSVHGWVWFASAFVGNILGTRLRPLFGMRV